LWFKLEDSDMPEFSAVWALITSKAGIAVMGALALLAIGLYAKHEHSEVIAWQGKYTTLEANYQAAQKDAAAKAAAARAANEETTRQLAERTDDANSQAQSAASDAVARYAAAHIVRPCGTPSAPGRPAAAPVPSGPAVDPGAGPAPDMVAVSRADLDQLTQAAVRAAGARNWAQSLIDRGLAVPVDDPVPATPAG
jgi:hypothetical protein